MIYIHAFFGCYGIFVSMKSIQKDGLLDVMTMVSSFMTVIFWVGYFTTK